MEFDPSEDRIVKILVINADCVTLNSSANLCHLAYLRGLAACGHEVALLSADGRHYKNDPAMAIPETVKSYTYYAVSLYEKMSMRKREVSSPAPAAVVQTTSQTAGAGGVKAFLRQCISNAKKTVMALYGIHGIYATFVRKAASFSLDEEFDYVLSLSTPVASHLLAHKLLQSGHIKAKHWIQIWEDPWYSDAYGFNGKDKVYLEEKRLLSFAEKVCYVSPLTLENQKRLYPESAHKMFWQPLPFYYQADGSENRVFEKNRYGYFGDYVPEARNLRPFYEAAVKSGIQVNICGNPSNLFPPEGNVHIHPRLPLDKLKPIEDSTNVLVFLCNRKGGQIPGKIYQYSATDKTILFIMDGTEAEQAVLREFFGKYNRYVFCQNTVEDISRAIGAIESGNLGGVENRPLDDFDPTITIENILKAGS